MTAVLHVLACSPLYAILVPKWKDKWGTVIQCLKAKKNPTPKQQQNPQKQLHNFLYGLLKELNTQNSILGKGVVQYDFSKAWVCK